MIAITLLGRTFLSLREILRVSTLEQLREKLMRPALVYPIGRALEKISEVQSLVGAVTHQSEVETWPEEDGVALRGLLQLCLEGLPFKPSGLEDVHFLTLFVHPDEWPEADKHWVLRTYKREDTLTPIELDLDSPQACRLLEQPKLVEDYPSYDDLEETIVDDLWDEFSTKFPTLEGIKLGGWPDLIQSEIFWAPLNKHPAKPRYVFQVDSIPEIGWQWGDGGCAYLGRGTIKGERNTWALDWQCY